MMFKTLIFCVMTALSLAACNTIDGVGKDLEKAGEAVQKSTK
jgi:entericidin B